MKRVATSLLILLLCAAPARAWGPLTHIASCLEAAEVAGPPVDEKLMGAFLAGATEPDLSCQGNLWKEYGVTHDERFAEAMERVAARKKSPDRERLLARALGLRAHLVGDSVAHARDGYPNVKQVFTYTAETGKANHTTTEFCVDVVVYLKLREAFRKHPLDFLDLGTWVEVRREYETLAGVKLADDPKEMRKALLLHRATILTERNVAEDLGRDRPETVAEMAEFFSDRASGVDGANGYDATIERMKAFYADRRKIVAGRDERTVPDRVVSFMGRVVRRVVEGNASLAERAFFSGLTPDLVKNEVKRMAAGLRTDGQATVARLMTSLLWEKGLSFRQALHLAERELAKPATDAERLLLLKKDADVLRTRVALAEAEWKNRPAWKVWRRVTQSDRRKHEALAVELAALEAEIAALETPAGTAEVTLAPASSAAYGRYLEAVESGDEERIRAAVEALEAGRR